MAQYKYAILFITWYDALKEYVTRFCRRLGSPHQKWIIFPGHAIPTSAIPTSAIPLSSSWIFDSILCCLSAPNTVYSKQNFKIYKPGWLSAKLVVLRSLTGSNDSDVVKEEYDMDPFFQSFRVYSNNSTNDALQLTLYDLFMAWCIDNSLWFPVTDTIQFHFIDHVGEERMISLTPFGPFKYVEIRQDKLYPVLASCSS